MFDYPPQEVAPEASNPAGTGSRALISGEARGVGLRSLPTGFRRISNGGLNSSLGRGTVRRLPVLMPLLLLLAVSCGKDNPVRPRPSLKGQIVFSGSDADTGGVTHLFVINADGTGLHQITFGSLNDSKPRWSPDGAKVAFVRVYGSSGDSSNIVVVDASGAGLARLTFDRYGDVSPSWSPDGSRISYQHDDTFLLDLWVMNADGSNPHLLMGADSTNSARHLTWTHQSTFLGDEFYGIDLQLTPTATRLTRILTIPAVVSGEPRLSPDGARIAFGWEGPDLSHTPHIYTAKVDGSDMKELTHGSETSPVWSPDGTRIAYVSGGRIWIMNADGANPVRLTTRTSSAADYLGDWKQ